MSYFQDEEGRYNNMVETPTGIRKFGLAVLLGLLAAFGPLTIDMYLPGFPSIARDLDTSASLVQLSLTACLLGLALGQLVVGPISDVKGRRNPLLIALFFYVLSSVLCAVAPNIAVLIAGRFMQGFSAAAGIVISRAIVRDMFQGSELTKFFALLMLIHGLAPILAPVAGGGILTFTDWNGIFIILGLIGIFMLFVSFWKLDETLLPEERRPSSFKQTLLTFGSLIKDRQFTGYTLAQGFMMAGIFAYVSGTPFVYQGIYNTSAQTFSLLFGMNGVGIIIGTQLVGRYAGVIAEEKLLQVGLLTTTVASSFLLIMTVLEGPLYSIIIPIFVFVSCIGLIGTTSFALAMEKQGHRAGSASALLGLLPFLLGAISAPLVGIAGEETAVPMGAIMFLSSLAALFSYYGLARTGDSQTEQH